MTTNEMVLVGIIIFGLFGMFLTGWILAVISILGVMLIRVPMIEIPMARIAAFKMRQAQEQADAEAEETAEPGEPTEDDLVAGGGHMEEDPKTGKEHWVRREDQN